MLDSRLLTFLTLCQTKSLTQTAKQLFITQPAVSHQLKYLENYYQTKLYSYQNRTFQLTPAGEYLYQFVSSLYSDSIRIKEQLPLLSFEKKELRLGAEPNAGESFLPYLIIKFIQQHPDYKIRIISDNYMELARKLNEGEIDFFLMDGPAPGNKYNCHELCQSSTVCICSPNHPLAGKTVEASDLYSSTLILGAEKTPPRLSLEAMFEKSNISSKKFQNLIEISNSLTMLKQLVAKNIGIAFLYKSGVAKELKNGTLQQIHVKNSCEPHSYNLVSLPNHYLHSVQADFVHFCQDFLQHWEEDT